MRANFDRSRPQLPAARGGDRGGADGRHRGDLDLHKGEINVRLLARVKFAEILRFLSASLLPRVLGGAVRL